jgi:hypothetical protein
MSAGSLFLAPDSGLRAFGEAIAWLWRLGPLLERPDPAAVGIARQEGAAALRALVDAGELAGGIVFATRPGPEEGPVPNRRWEYGKASFGPGRTVEGQFSLFDGAGPITSSLGSHAVREDNWLVVGADPLAGWGSLRDHWLLPGIADFLVAVLDRPLLTLPPLGCVRYDDLPGNAFQQILGRDHPDDKVERRVREVTEHFGAQGAPISFAITPRTLKDGQEVDVESVWPRSIAAIAAGIESGAIEPVCHGYLHLNTNDWAEGTPNPREFRDVEREEAERRVAYGMAWSERTLGVTPPSYVAPTWAYGPGLLEVLRERELPAWLPVAPGPLADGAFGRETLTSGMEGLVGFDYGPFAAMAAAGLPATVVVHGGLFDLRAGNLRDPRALVTTAQLVRRRDLFRFPWVDGVRWIGSRELLDRLRAHGNVGFEDGRVVNPDGAEVVVRGAPDPA